MPGWHARYRCEKCGVFGTRRKLVEGFRGEGIAEIHCRKKGCEGLAVGKPVVGRDGRRKEWRCRAHHPEGA